MISKNDSVRIIIIIFTIMRITAMIMIIISVK